MGIKKNKNQLIISIIVGVAIAVISHQVIIKLKIENDNLKKLTQTSAQAPAKKIIYVVAKTDIKKGEKIDPENLTTKRFPVEIEGAVSEVSQISGLKAKKDIKADAPIVEDYFKTSDIELTTSEPRSGYRAVAVLIASEQLPSFAQEGEFVDLYFTKNTLQAQNIRILSIQDTSGGTSKSVMLELKEKDIGAFIAAAAVDKPVLVQRNRHERAGYKFVSAIPSSSLAEMSSPPELTEISDIPLSETVPVQNAVYSQAPRSSVPVIKSQLKNEGEIEIISGDKKMIVGVGQ